MPTPASPFDLTSKVAVVTGGNGGIGLGMAKGLAKAGAKLVVAGRNPEKSAAAVAELIALGTTALALPVDVVDPESCKRLIAETTSRLGRLDILVNNAGINIRARPELATPAQWREVLAINLDGAFYCSQAAYPAFKETGGGKVINIGSMMSIFAAPYAPAYAASKGGVVQMTKSLAAAWAADNIQVNAILPGWIETELTRNARLQVKGLHERVLERTPAARWGTPADFEGIAVFYASPASQFITGSAVTVDGGFSILG
jgi:2-deoxy-D-gluconate 3-dehydrogenase